jgi:23S rRNA-/tRNA-specific pseudouridylate synthase
MMFLASEIIETSQVIYEDNHLIVINKKASEIVQGACGVEQTLLKLI